MARYSAINLLDKIFITRRVFNEFKEIPNTPHLFILTAVRTLNKQYRETNIHSISLFLRANGRTSSFKDIEKAVEHFVSIEYLKRAGKNDRRVYLTEIGKRALNDLEKEIRTSHFKFRRTDTGKVVTPGRKKGKPQKPCE